MDLDRISKKIICISENLQYPYDFKLANSLYNHFKDIFKSIATISTRITSSEYVISIGDFRIVFNKDKIEFSYEYRLTKTYPKDTSLESLISLIEKNAKHILGHKGFSYLSGFLLRKEILEKECKNIGVVFTGLDIHPLANQNHTWEFFPVKIVINGIDRNNNKITIPIEFSVSNYTYIVLFEDKKYVFNTDIKLFRFCRKATFNEINIKRVEKTLEEIIYDFKNSITTHKELNKYTFDHEFKINSGLVLEKGSFKLKTSPLFNNSQFNSATLYKTSDFINIYEDPNKHAYHISIYRYNSFETEKTFTLNDINSFEAFLKGPEMKRYLNNFKQSVIKYYESEISKISYYNEEPQPKLKTKKELLEEISDSFYSFSLGKSFMKDGPYIEGNSVVRSWRDWGYWYSDRDDGRDDEDYEDDDHQVLSDKDYQKAVSRINDWVANFSWKDQVEISVDTGEKNWLYIYITLK